MAKRVMFFPSAREIASGKSLASLASPSVMTTRYLYFEFDLDPLLATNTSWLSE